MDSTAKLLEKLLSQKNPETLRKLAGKLSCANSPLPEEVATYLEEVKKTSISCRKILAQALRALADLEQCNDKSSL